MTRRAFVASSVGAALALARGRAVATASPVRFHSRPDLTPPLLSVGTAARGRANGYVFAAPFSGQRNGTALIADDSGEPVWVHQSPELVMNFRVQELGGQPVLTWWEGTVVNGFFEGECVIADESYSIVKRLSAGNGYAPEVHEFLITPRDTALVSINNFVPRDLTSYGGPAQGTVIDGVVQEIDIATGAVLFEWHSLDHVGLDETTVGPAAVWDYFHLNSIDVDESDGNLVVSARYPSTVYKIDRQTGNVLWRLGGAKSDFVLSPDAVFWFQHDARMHPGGLISIFDDGADAPGDAREPAARAIVLSLDETARTASLVRSFPNPHGAVTVAMGSAQLLADGGFFVGWGTTPEISEFAADGSVVYDATFPGGEYSYRAFRSQWEGRAPGRPAVATVRNANGSVDVYSSWNGATRVAQWRIVGGASQASVEPLLTVTRSGFETRARIAQRPRYAAAAALDAHGRVLGTSAVVRT